MMKKFYKSRENKVLCGVIGGVGEYFNIDPVILRLIWLVIVVFTGFFPGAVVYLAACLIAPQKPKE